MTSVKQSTPSRVPGIHYTVTGDGPGTVVLLHGFADNLHTWHRVVPRLAVDHRVIAIDLPGFGLSGRRWRTPLLEGYADVVLEVLDAEGVAGPVSLVGNSMGAAVATVLAAHHPERVERTVLIDMPGVRRVPRVWRLAMSRPAELGARLLPCRTAQAGLGLFYAAVAAADFRMVDPLTRAGFCAPYARRGSLADIVPIGRHLLEELATAGLGQLVAAGDVPTLVVFGGRDLLTPVRSLRRWDGRHAMVVLPQCGHCPQLDDPAALLAELVPFLRPVAAAVAA